jgi:hypothetical protein
MRLMAGAAGQTESAIRTEWRRYGSSQGSQSKSYSTAWPSLSKGHKALIFIANLAVGKKAKKRNYSIDMSKIQNRIRRMTNIVKEVRPALSVKWAAKRQIFFELIY